MSSYDYPDMPTSEAEWRAHWAFYKLTVAQRDAAWREIEQLRSAVATPPEPDRCLDCGVAPGVEHLVGCDMARCVVTGEQRITCESWRKNQHYLAPPGHDDCGRDVWEPTTALPADG